MQHVPLLDHDVLEVVYCVCILSVVTSKYSVNMYLVDCQLCVLMPIISYLQFQIPSLNLSCMALDLYCLPLL